MNSDPLQQAVAIPAARPDRGRRILGWVADFLRHARQRWYLYLPIVAIWSLAYVRLFVDATPRVPVLFNWTPSLPYRVAWLQHGLSPAAARRFHRFLVCRRGPAALSGAARSALLQDRARFAGRYRHGHRPAGRHQRRGCRCRQETRPTTTRPLAPIAPTVIPPRYYYVQGTSPDSFDSRYRESGLIRAEQVIGVVVPLF